jgi:gas vesicle protein
MSSGKVLLGLVAGFAAGSLLGILFAPKKGSDTREKISKKGEDYVDSLKEKFNEFRATVTEKFEKVKEDVSDFSETEKARSEEV